MERRKPIYRSSFARKRGDDYDHDRRIAPEDNYCLRSSAIGFLKNFLCICDLSGFSWCMQSLVLEKNCVMWVLCTRLIWYDTNLVCYHCCDLICYDVVTCFVMMLLWFSLFLLFWCDLFSSLLLSIALWFDMFYVIFLILS